MNLTCCRKNDISIIFPNKIIYLHSKKIICNWFSLNLINILFTDLFTDFWLSEFDSITIIQKKFKRSFFLTRFSFEGVMLKLTEEASELGLTEYRKLQNEIQQYQICIKKATEKHQTYGQT